MWKYIDENQVKDFLLSLYLYDYKDSKKYIKALYSISNNIENNYKIYHIKKKNGKYRTIYEPSPLLKNIQKRILENILNNKKISKYAKAYHKGISLKDNASPHIKKDIILKLDINNFFENISFLDVYNSCFQIEYFPKSIGMLLTYLCTYEDHLVIGSPTSAYISNLVMKDFDEEVGSWCENNNITYTRYSDDMTFSGNFNPSEVIKFVKKNLLYLNLTLNNAKTHVIKKSSNQNVTGITVNEKIQANINYRRKIRQEIYYIKKYGLTSHIRKTNIKTDEKTYINSLYGRISFVLSVNSNDKEFLEYKKYIYQMMK